MVRVQTKKPSHHVWYIGRLSKPKIIYEVLEFTLHSTSYVQRKKMEYGIIMIGLSGRYEQRVVSNFLWPISIYTHGNGSAWRQSGSHADI